MAGLHNFIIEQGSTWTRTVTWEGVNITGYTARMYLKRKITNTTPALQLTTENSRITLTTPASGVMTLSLSATETAALSGEYVYDLELVNGAAVTRLLQGRVIVSPEVTK